MRSTRGLILALAFGFSISWCGTLRARVTLDAMIELYADPVAVAFGANVKIEGDLAVVANRFGVYVLERGLDGWTQQAFVNSFLFLPADGAPVRLALDGAIIVVGVASDPSAGPLNAGAVYVIQRVGGVWGVTHQLLASDPDEHDFFGSAVSLHGDWLLIGAEGDDEGGGGAGAAYFFSTATWTQQQKVLGIPGGSPFTCLGQAGALRGEWAALGTSFDGVYVYRLQAGVWTEVEFFPPTPPPTNFGNVVAIDDGPTIVVGDAPPQGGGPGRAFVYEFDGMAWSETELMASDSEPGAFFGSRIAIRGDSLVIAEPSRDTGGLERSGRATLFRKLGGSWTEVAVLVPSDLNAFDAFGSEVALDDTGQLFVGAGLDDTAGPNAGSAYLFFVGDGFHRGDANLDGDLNIADAVTVLNHLFGGAGALDCADAADANDDGTVNIADSVFSLLWLFLPSSPPLPGPFPGCGYDLTADPLDCSSPTSCL